MATTNDDDDSPSSTPLMSGFPAVHPEINADNFFTAQEEFFSTASESFQCDIQDMLDKSLICLNWQNRAIQIVMKRSEFSFGTCVVEAVLPWREMEISSSFDVAYRCLVLHLLQLIVLPTAEQRKEMLQRQIMFVSTLEDNLFGSCHVQSREDFDELEKFHLRLDSVLFPKRARFNLAARILAVLEYADLNLTMHCNVCGRLAPDQEPVDPLSPTARMFHYSSAFSCAPFIPSNCGNDLCRFREIDSILHIDLQSELAAKGDGLQLLTSTVLAALKDARRVSLVYPVPENYLIPAPPPASADAATAASGSGSPSAAAGAASAVGKTSTGRKIPRQAWGQQRSDTEQDSIEKRMIQRGISIDFKALELDLRDLARLIATNAELRQHIVRHSDNHTLRLFFATYAMKEMQIPAVALEEYLRQMRVNPDPRFMPAFTEHDPLLANGGPALSTDSPQFPAFAPVGNESAALFVPTPAAVSARLYRLYRLTWWLCRAVGPMYMRAISQRSRGMAASFGSPDDLDCPTAGLPLTLANALPEKRENMYCVLRVWNGLTEREPDVYGEAAEETPFPPFLLRGSRTTAATCVYDAAVAAHQAQGLQSMREAGPSDLGAHHKRMRSTPATSQLEVSLFHGSREANWFSILRYGIRSLSNTRHMVSGAAHGPGAYFGKDLATSQAYGPILGVVTLQCTPSVVPSNPAELNVSDFGWCVTVKRPEGLLRLTHLVCQKTLGHH